MEIRILIFIGLTAFAAIMNTLLVVFAYKAFAGLTSSVTNTVSEFAKNSESRQWIESLKVAAEQAVEVTEATKHSVAELEPALSRAREDYSRTLALLDSKLTKVAVGINTSAQTVRDVVAKPAFSLMAFAAGVAKVFETMDNEH